LPLELVSWQSKWLTSYKEACQAWRKGSLDARDYDVFNIVRIIATTSHWLGSCGTDTDDA